MNKIHDVIIIGAGTAGIAAAIQLKRYNIDLLLFESDRIGGLLHNANLVENYPGFPHGIRGPALVDLLRRHLVSSNVDAIKERVIEVDFSDGLFHLKTTQNVYMCRIVMLASGTKPKALSVSTSDSEVRSRILYEVHPLLEIRDKQIAIIGAGDAAFDYALNLARFNHVTINNRIMKTSCIPLLWERMKQNENIEYRENCLLEYVNSIENELQITWRKNEKDWKENVDFLLAAIGRTPQIDYLSASIQSRLTEFTAEGTIHLIGDVKNGIYRQFSIAAGDGVKAAMIAVRKLSEIR